MRRLLRDLTGICTAAGCATAISGDGPLRSDDNRPFVEEGFADKGKRTGDADCLNPFPIQWRYRIDGLPLGESRPGADVTLLVDFDGGRYDSKSSRRVTGNYDENEERQVRDTIEQVAGNYWFWSVNVTTDRAVFDRASQRARILIADDEDSSSGKADVHGISSDDDFTAYAGYRGVFAPNSSGRKCAYLVTHEFGHNFGLRGTEKDYEDTRPDEDLGAFMGGRGSFDGYRWKALDAAARLSGTR